MMADNQRSRAPRTDDLYSPLDFVVVRTPMLPVEFYRTMCADSFVDHALDRFLENPQIRSAVMATSPSLVRAFASSCSDTKDRARANRKLRRYLIRMSTRPTPFGQFAGVGIAALGKETTLRLDETPPRHCRHLDVPWLLELVHRMESDPLIFRQLRFQTNPCLYKRGGRVFLRELSPLSTSQGVLNCASLRATKMVTRVLDKARVPIRFDELSESLLGAAGASEGKAQRFLTELWRQEFLLSDLRPPFTNGDPSSYILERLDQIVGAETFEQEIRQCMEEGDPDSNRCAARSPSPKRNNAADESEWARTTHTDRLFSTSGELNINVAKEAARAAELLLSLTTWPSGPPYLTTYRQSFEERYGVDREVPLLEMIDPEFGIGVPSAYDAKRTSQSLAQPAALRVRRDLLFDIAQAAREQGRSEIELDEKTLRQLRTCDPHAHDVPETLEINVFVDAGSLHDLEKGRFTVVVGPNVGAMEAGRSLGRFAQALGAAGIGAFRDAGQIRGKARSPKLYAELSYIPRKIQLTNIMTRPGRRQWEVNVGAHAGVPLGQSIAVRDLVVGIREGRFYVRAPALGCDIQICSGSMANAEFAPFVCRLLSDLMMDGIPVLREFDWGVASMNCYLPRVRVGRAVLSVAKWRISELTLKRAFCLDREQAFITSLACWRERWNVPRHVHLTEADNRLVLDLEHPMDREDLREELRRLAPGDSITLEEVFPCLDDAWLAGPKGRFVAEYVVPLVARHPIQAPAPVVRTSATGPISDSHGAGICRRLRTPGSEWLYIKLYVAPSLADDLLTGAICDFAHGALRSARIHRWFFVRYADPAPHIRVRFKGEAATLTHSLLPELLSWAQGLVEQDICLRFAIDTYDREVERYGGDSAIDLAEDLFFYDSESVVGLLGMLEEGCPFSRVELAVFALNSLFESLECDFDDRLALLEIISAERQASGNVYRERKATLQALTGIRHPPSMTGILQKLSRSANAHVLAVADIARRYRALEQTGCLTVSIDSIYRSLAHMRCNRLGLESTTERLAYGLLARSYLSRRALCETGAPMLDHAAASLQLAAKCQSEVENGKAL